MYGFCEVILLFLDLVLVGCLFMLIDYSLKIWNNKIKYGNNRFYLLDDYILYCFFLDSYWYYLLKN